MPNVSFVGCPRDSALSFIIILGHSTKNDISMEVLRDFCTRETFLRSVPVAQLRLKKGHGINGIELSNIHATVVNYQYLYCKCSEGFVSTGSSAHHVASSANSFIIDRCYGVQNINATCWCGHFIAFRSLLLIAAHCCSLLLIAGCSLLLIAAHCCCSLLLIAADCC